MSVDVKYTTAATATGGRDGRSKTEDGSLDVRLATPKELGGGGEGNNPEQLFAAGYAACFLGAMKAVAAKGDTAKVPGDATVKASVGIGPRSEGGFGLDIQLDVSLPGVPREQAQDLVEKAHHVCPYSNATRNNVPVRLNVV